NNLNCLNKVNINSKIKKKKIILQFFGIRNILKQLYDPILENDCANYFDITVRADADKIILCKFVKHSEDMLDTLDDIANESFKELQKIKENKYIGLNYINESPLNCNIVPTKVLNFKVLILFEKISFDYMLVFSRDWKQENIFIYNTIDIEPIFELLEKKDSDSILSFIQYIDAEKKLSAQNKHPTIQTDALDSFAYYYQNNESFYIMGNQPNMMFFDTHQWSNFYNEYLYGKYQDNIYELIEAKFPNQFNLINHAMGETYNFMDSSIISGGRCVKFQNKLIWIMYPIAINCIDIEVKTFEFVGQFISFYLDKYKSQLFKLISKYGFDFTKQDFTIGLYPSSLISRINELSHLIPYIENIQSKKIVFLTKKPIHNDKLHTFIIYHADMDSLNDLFKLTLNFNPEKKIFKNFLESILNYYKIVNIHEISDNFINEHWDIKERAFTFTSKYVDNPRLESYKNPKKIQLSFLQGVNQEIVTYLKNLNIESKEYWDVDAKNLNNLIFEFLQIKLEDEISKFNNSIIYYCYEQIEYIEGKREKDSFSAGVHSSHYIEFDIEKQFNEDRMEISQLTTCAKHILHTILKVNPKGYKALVDSDWYYLMALSSVINETIQRSDHLHHKLVKAGIKITTNYEMIDIDEISSINFHAYHQQITNSKIHESKKLIQKEKISIKNENPKKIPIMDEKLNLAWFKEYDFYLDDMLVVLSNLGRFDFKKDNYFPLNFISFEEINNFIQTYIIEPPSSITLQKILNFLSLSYETFNNFKYIDYSIDRLMQKKERINLSPFIKINDKYLFGNQLTILSTKAWFYPLKEGDIPFSIEDNSLVKEELKIIHRKLDLELENDSYNVAKELLGENYSIKTLKNFKRIHKSFERLPSCGEIDLLLVNPKTHTIFVLDAKNINKKLFTSAIKRELRDFFHGRDKKKSYLEKLDMKVDFINNNLEKVLGYFKLNNDEKWNIKKGFVVNTLYFSAFYEEKVDFILLDDLHEYLKQ
uniref:hypothetical protein n=1 Tax=Aliarcobacter butzleri TaxID=28197 RepID=UPI0018678CAF